MCKYFSQKLLPWMVFWLPQIFGRKVESWISSRLRLKGCFLSRIEQFLKYAVWSFKEAPEVVAFNGLQLKTNLFF